MAHNRLLVYNTTTQTTNSANALYRRVSAVNDFHLLGSDLYVVYNSIARFIKNRFEYIYKYL